jgi:hypothetical protein
MARVFYSLIITLLFSITLIQAETSNVSVPFTGTITGSKVRMRCGPDLDSLVVQELKKNDLVLVVGDTQEFWAVEPPTGTKVYIFRSYILDNTIEASRVNVRLQPDFEAPILGQLKQGDHIEGHICAQNHKWMEITAPKNIHFYVSKEYVNRIGDGNFFAHMQKRKEEAEKLLNSAFFLTQNECKKPFNEMQPQEAVQQFEAIIKGYPDFTEYVQQAKEGLSLLQDNYLQKKIAYLEAKANLTTEEKEKLLAELPKRDPSPHAPKQQTNKMLFWNAVEESLYQTWASLHPQKSIDDFYREQEVNGIQITGIIESFDTKIQERPGDFLINDSQGPIAYLYSTRIDLEKHIGKTVTINVSARENNNFAFPAYFVTSIKE